MVKINRLICIVLVMLFTMSICSASPAETKPITHEKPHTAILYYDNLNAPAPTKIELKNYYIKQLTEKLAQIHNIVDGEEYIQKFKSIGIDNLIATDRSKMIPVFQTDNINYVIIIDMQPITRKYYEWNSDKMVSSQYLKVIDVNNNRTLYHIQFSHGSRSASAKKHVEELYKKTEEALLQLLPK